MQDIQQGCSHHAVLVHELRFSAQPSHLYMALCVCVVFAGLLLLVVSDGPRSKQAATTNVHIRSDHPDVFVGVFIASRTRNCHLRCVWLIMLAVASQP